MKSILSLMKIGIATALGFQYPFNYVYGSQLYIYSFIHKTLQCMSRKKKNILFIKSKMFYLFITHIYIHI